MSDWQTYFKKHASRKPRELLVRAVEHCKQKHAALDLGAGTLIESSYLLESGFEKITAVDNSPQSKEFTVHLDKTRFELQEVQFNNFTFSENTYNLINAQFALPFYGKENFDEFIKDIKNSLQKEGIFVGQFFGVNDEWNTTESKLAFQTKEEVLALLSPLEMVEFLEEEKDGTTAAGNTKHWHVFHFICKKI